MKEFWNIMKKDFLSEHYTTKELVIYGILVPIVLFGLMCLADWMDHLSDLV